MKKVAYFSIWLAWALPIVWTLSIMTMSGNLGAPANTFVIFHWVMSWFTTALDSDTLNLYHFYCRKVLHVICYGLLTILWFRAWMVSFPERLKTNTFLALGLTLMVAAADEGRQYFVPARTASFWDIGLDMSGGIFFLFLIACGWKFRNRPSTTAPPPP